MQAELRQPVQDTIEQLAGLARDTTRTDDYREERAGTILRAAQRRLDELRDKEAEAIKEDRRRLHAVAFARSREPASTEREQRRAAVCGRLRDAEPEDWLAELNLAEHTGDIARAQGVLDAVLAQRDMRDAPTIEQDANGELDVAPKFLRPVEAMERRYGVGKAFLPPERHLPVFERVADFQERQMGTLQKRALELIREGQHAAPLNLANELVLSDETDEAKRQAGVLPPDRSGGLRGLDRPLPKRKLRRTPTTKGERVEWVEA